MLNADSRTSCPAWLIAAPASGQGKSTIVAAVARYHRRRGLDVRVFKAGPDFLDPKIHERASGHPVYQLDLFMVGEQHCKELLYKAAKQADLILVEGVMGLFDGNPSSADLAIRFGLPVITVIDVSAMAQTFGALAHGLTTYNTQLNFSGVVANRIASDHHEMMLRESVGDTVKWLAGIRRSDSITLPERHLGIHQADDIDDLDVRLERAADCIENTLLASLPKAVEFESAPLEPVASTLLAGKSIAIARDKAFSFIYQANLDLLYSMGAELIFFSPLKDRELPDVDAIYLPGGYPELYLSELSNNIQMIKAIKHHYKQGKVIVAECGGMLYLLDRIEQSDGAQYKLCEIMQGTARMQTALGGLGLQFLDFPAGILRGHTFHYSIFKYPPKFDAYATKHPSQSEGEGVVCNNNVLASYVHWYFPSNPSLIAGMFLGHSN